MPSGIINIFLGFKRPGKTELVASYEFQSTESNRGHWTTSHLSHPYGSAGTSDDLICTTPQHVFGALFFQIIVHMVCQLTPTSQCQGARAHILQFFERPRCNFPTDPRVITFPSARGCVPLHVRRQPIQQINILTAYTCGTQTCSRQAMPTSKHSLCPTNPEKLIMNPMT
jgi:hypothetical protein